MDLILATASTQKKSLMNKLGLVFSVVDPHISDEAERLVDESPQELVKRLALQKALVVAADHKVAYIVGHHMVVVHKNIIIGKPKTDEEATEILERLDGDEHEVVGCLTIVQGDKAVYQGVQSTKVEIKDLSKSEIENYVKTKEPLDKAGGYAIQGKGSMFIKDIDGSYFNIAGLPLNMLITGLEKHGFEIDDEVKNTVKLQEKSIKESFPR